MSEDASTGIMIPIDWLESSLGENAHLIIDRFVAQGDMAMVTCLRCQALCFVGRDGLGRIVGGRHHLCMGCVEEDLG